MNLLEIKVGDIFLATDLKLVAHDARWRGKYEIKFKTKTTKPILYIAIPKWDGSVKLWNLNPESQFKYVDNSPEGEFWIGRDTEQEWMKIWNSLKYLGSEETLAKFTTDSDDFYHHYYAGRANATFYKKWAKVAKEQGFVEEPVEDYVGKTEYLESAKDFTDQDVHVGDSVAYVQVSWGQGFRVGVVKAITKYNFMVDGSARPHYTVIKVDPNKVHKF